jgi:MFS transporter, FSR family, fosmidomycin resistance protein
VNFRIYLLPFLAKSFTVYFFVLLPVLYSHKIISSVEVGYFGAISIGALVVGALVVSKWLHHVQSRDILVVGSWLAVLATLLLGAGLMAGLIWLILLSYVVSGLLVGIAMSATNALVARYTNRGNRYSVLARSSMLGDINRITFPLVVALALALGGLAGAIVVMLVVAAVFLWAAVTLPREPSRPDDPDLPPAKLRHNRLFQYFLGMEFLDSFASSQLFVFVPILFLAKGYSLQSSLVLQTAIFLGYFSGRWVISRIARRNSGIFAVGVAEAGMVIAIALLLIAHNLFVLYFLTWLLGLFARGTSPVIKALAFDSLHDDHMKQGSAFHVVAGDSGSALGQLCFGILLAWLGVNAPFIAAAIIAAVIAVFCAARLRSTKLA